MGATASLDAMLLRLPACAARKDGSIGLTHFGLAREFRTFGLVFTVHIILLLDGQSHGAVQSSIAEQRASLRAA